MSKRIGIRSVSALPSPQDHDRPGFWAYLRLRHRNAGSRISAAFDYFLLRIRHRDAWSSDSESAETIAPGHGFESLRGGLCGPCDILSAAKLAITLNVLAGDSAIRCSS